MRRLGFLAGAAALILGAQAGEAAAQTVDPALDAFYGAEVAGHTDGATAEFGGNFASAGDTPGGPRISVRGDADLDTSAGASWQIKIIGGPGAFVPIRITGLYDADVTGSAIVSGAMDIGLTGFLSTRLFTFSCNTPGNNGFGACGENDFFYTVKVGTNSDYTISIETGGLASATLPGTFNDVIDPLVTIDPSYDGPPVTLDIAAGGFPTSATPEPSAWALMLLGFGGLGVALRRRAALA